MITQDLAKGYKVFGEADLEKLEVPTSKVSNKYKPIKTSKFLQSAQIPFKKGLLKGSKQIVYANARNLICTIENSFDGSLSFRTCFSDGNINFGFVKQIHKGEHAQDIEKMSSDFMNTIHNAAYVLPKLKNMTLPLNTKQELFNSAFIARGLKLRLKSLTPSIDEYSDNAYEFFVILFKNIKDGNFYYKTTKLRKGRALTNEFKNLEIQRKVWNKLKEIHIEMYF